MKASEARSELGLGALSPGTLRLGALGLGVLGLGARGLLPGPGSWPLRPDADPTS